MTPQENQRIVTGHVEASKRAFRARHPQVFTLCSFKIDVSDKFSHEPQIRYLKIYVSCEAFANFQHRSQKATPATEFARCHHLTQP